MSSESKSKWNHSFVVNKGVQNITNWQNRKTSEVKWS